VGLGLGPWVTLGESSKTLGASFLPRHGGLPYRILAVRADGNWLSRRMAPLSITGVTHHDMRSVHLNSGIYTAGSFASVAILSATNSRCNLLHEQSLGGGGTRHRVSRGTRIPTEQSCRRHCDGQGAFAGHVDSRAQVEGSTGCGGLCADPAPGPLGLSS
jgi:hypothetical protein